jgi:DNA-binding transcriptional ArsR family regulator
MDAGGPPPYLVRRLKALADERRLRILRLLQHERRTLQELADEFGLPKTTIHHHLAMLRAAGFIHLREESSRQYMPHPRYTYRAEAVPRAIDALAAYLRIEDR